MPLKRQRIHPENPLPFPKKSRRGEFLKKYAKGFLVGRVRACPHRRRGLLTAPLKFGSRKSVKLHHFGKRTEIAAHSGGFFSGGAQRQPAVFLGGMRFGAPACWRTFLFSSRHRRLSSDITPLLLLLTLRMLQC